jgi:hypothetical protein
VVAKKLLDEFMKLHATGQPEWIAEASKQEAADNIKKLVKAHRIDIETAKHFEKLALQKLAEGE